MPSLGTATKLARGLRELRDDADTTQYLGLVASGSMNPTARVEYALRADDLLTEPQVRQIMEYYLAVRIRRYGRAFQPDQNTSATSSDRGSDRTLDATGRPRPPDEFLQRRRRRRSRDGPPGRPSHRPGARPLLTSARGTTRIALHRPGRRASERQRLGRWRSRFRVAQGVRR